MHTYNNLTVIDSLVGLSEEAPLNIPDHFKTPLGQKVIREIHEQVQQLEEAEIEEESHEIMRRYVFIKNI